MRIAFWLEGHEILVAGILSEYFDVGFVLRTFHQLTGRIHGLVSFALVTLVFLMLGLLEVDTTRRKIEGLSNPDLGRSLLDAFASIASASIERCLELEASLSMSPRRGSITLLIRLSVPVSTTSGCRGIRAPPPTMPTGSFRSDVYQRPNGCSRAGVPIYRHSVGGDSVRPARVPTVPRQAGNSGCGLVLSPMSS